MEETMIIRLLLLIKRRNCLQRGRRNVRCKNERKYLWKDILFFFFFFSLNSTATINFSAVNPSKNSSSWWSMSPSISYIFHMMKYIFQRVYSSKMRKKIRFSRHDKAFSRLNRLNMTQLSPLHPCLFRNKKKIVS